MATKHFKIGEYCAGGVITAIATSKLVTVIQKEWDYSQGSRRSECKIDKCAELDRIEVAPNDSGVHRKLSNFLNDITTSYYSDKVIEWIETKVTLKDAFGTFGW